MNIKNHPKFFDFVQSFTRKDGNKPDRIATPFIFMGNLVATDSYKLLTFNDKDWCEENHIPQYDIDKKIGINAYEVTKRIVEGYIESTDRIEAIGIVHLQDFKNQLHTIRQNPKYKYKYSDCSYCDGDGNTECPCCKQDVECKMCGGVGTVTVPESSEMGWYKYPPDEYFVLKSKEHSISLTFSLSVIEGLIYSLDKIDIKILEVCFVENLKAVFRIYQTDIYILTIGRPDENKINHVVQIYKNY